MKRYMQFRRKAKKLPLVLSIEEVGDFLAAVPGPGLKVSRGLGHRLWCWFARVRNLFLDRLKDLHRAGQLTFFGDLDHLAQQDTFAQWLAPFRKTEWVVYAKPPFGGPEAVLAYLSRYTHRVAISNHRLVTADADNVAFRWKDYRVKRGGRQKVMRLSTSEFIRRFLIPVLPDGFHRIRHYGLLASSARKTNITKIRDLMGVQRVEQPDTPEPESEIVTLTLREPCPCCGGQMRIIEIFRRGQKPMSRAPPREQAA